MTSLRIGFLIDRWEPARGGAERALAALARHLERRGHRVLVFASSGSSGAPGELHPVRAGGLTRRARERRLARALVEAAREADCDLTVGARHLGEVDLYWPHGGSHAATLAARRRARGSAPDPAGARGRHRLFLDFERALLGEGGARRVVCVSELVHAELAEAWPACRERLVVIENGVDTSAFHPDRRGESAGALRSQLGIGAAEPIVAFAAREPELKGLPVLLEALAQLEHEPWQLVIAGPKRPGTWRRRALRAGVPAERLRVVEHLEPELLWPGADLAVLPTWRDTSGLTILEALASGTPVITTREAGAAVHVSSPAAGTVLDDPGDVEALGAALSHWLGRARTGAVDREAVRACVEGLDEGRWLARLERELRSLAR